MPNIQTYHYRISDYGYPCVEVTSSETSEERVYPFAFGDTESHIEAAQMFAESTGLKLAGNYPITDARGFVHHDLAV